MLSCEMLCWWDNFTEFAAVISCSHAFILCSRMTKCTFHKFGTSGNIEKHDALCILPLNIGNILHPSIFFQSWSHLHSSFFEQCEKAQRPFCILPANIGYCQRKDPLNGITLFAVNEKIYISILTFFLPPFSPPSQNLSNGFLVSVDVGYCP